MGGAVRGCPVCGGMHLVPHWPIDPSGVRGSVDVRSFRPSSARFGEPIGTIVRCGTCGHGAVGQPPPKERLAEAYSQVEDIVSLREWAGQCATADRGLARLEAFVRPARLLDVGCWTGAFVEAAASRGWTAQGIERSAWAVDRAVERGLEVARGEIDHLCFESESMRALALCDVLEHLEDPDAALAALVRLLEPGGALYLTVPDAGSLVARGMGQRWWSVLPMHLQYFTRTSMQVLLARHGLRPVHIGTHTKSFSARYYAERITGYSPSLGRLAVWALEGVGLAGRTVTPNFLDRMEVIAVRR